MSFNKLDNQFRWGIVGGFLGGLIAIIGFGIFTILAPFFIKPINNLLVFFYLIKHKTGSNNVAPGELG